MPDGCWSWRKSLRQGYGQTWADGRPWVAHRLVYVLLMGPVPDGLHLHHECHIRRCVNPAHLTPIKPTAHQNLHFVLDGACTAGHPWTPRNTYIRSNGQRQCRACKAVTERSRRARVPRASQSHARAERRRKAGAWVS